MESSRSVRKNIYLYGFNYHQLKIIKKKYRKVNFVVEKKITSKVNLCDAVIAPTRTAIEVVLNKIDFKKNKILKWIHLPCSGVEKYTKFFKFKKIKFTNGKKLQNHQISDHAIGLLLCITRKINFNIKYNQNIQFDKRPIELYQKKAVIIGYGGNGAMISKKLLAFNMKINAVNINKKNTPKGVKFYLTKNILSAVNKADVLFITTPLTNKTKNIVNSRIIKRLNKGAIVINVSRAECLNKKDLIIYLRNKHLGGAGLDVVEGEILDENDILFSFNNVVVTPHVGGISDSFSSRSINLIFKNIKRFLDSKSLINLVDAKKGY